MQAGRWSGEGCVFRPTGNAPFHLDSNNHAILAGVHVRPFPAPNAKGLNQWYFEHVDHVLRLVVSA